MYFSSHQNEMLIWSILQNLFGVPTKYRVEEGGSVSALLAGALQYNFVRDGIYIERVGLFFHHDCESSVDNLGCVAGACTLSHSVHREWQLPHSGVHSIMMDKLAQPGEGGRCTLSPLTLSTITYSTKL